MIGTALSYEYATVLRVGTKCSFNVPQRVSTITHIATMITNTIFLLLPCMLNNWRNSIVFVFTPFWFCDPLRTILSPCSSLWHIPRFVISRTSRGEGKNPNWLSLRNRQKHKTINPTETPQCVLKEYAMRFFRMFQHIKIKTMNQHSSIEHHSGLVDNVNRVIEKMSQCNPLFAISTLVPSDPSISRDWLRR